MALTVQLVVLAALAAVASILLNQYWRVEQPGEADVMAFDVVIVGCGLAGLSTALHLAEADSRVSIALLDKNPRCGGNSAKASSGISAAVDTADVEKFRQDALTPLSHPDLLRILVDRSSAAVQWLQSHSVPLSLVSQLGGHSSARTWRNKGPPNVGYAIISKLHARAKMLDKQISIRNNVRVRKLLRDDHMRVRGCAYEALAGEGGGELLARKAVVLATGGYSANRDLLPEGLKEMPTTNDNATLGDGLVMAMSIGARMRDIDAVQVHPTGFVDPNDRQARTKFLAPEALRGSGALLLNDNGRRFVNELATRDKVSQAVLEQPGKRAFLLLNEEAMEKFGVGTLNFYFGKGFGRKVESLTAVAEYISSLDSSRDAGVIYEELRSTLGAYKLSASGGETDPYGKTVFPTVDLLENNKTFAVMEVTPVVHYCMGGLRIDTNARVLTEDDVPIPGLYAVGEVAGGVHGSNRLGGNSLLECVVFSSVAAETILQEG